MTDPVLSEQLLGAFSLALSYWWAYLPAVFVVASYQIWMYTQRKQFLMGMKWVLLEVIPPPDVPKSPKLAESIFAGMHGIYTGSLAWKKQFFKGEVPAWFSFELVSNGGEIHFLVRTPEDLRNVVESNIFAQYPDAEIRIVEDYIDLLPSELPDEQHDLFATELVFKKEDAYPIKTWREFEEAGGKDEHSRIDPLAPLLEVMSALRPGEYIWIQTMMRPTGDAWVKEGAKIVDELSGKEPKKSEDPFLAILGIFGEIVGGILTAVGVLGPEEEKEKKDDKEFSLQKLRPAEKLVLESVEYKLAKLAFKCGIRVMYAGHNDVFMPARVSTITGMYKQLYYNNMNSFTVNKNRTTKSKGLLPWLFASDKGWFAKAQTKEIQRELWDDYRSRKFPPKHVILNTEELATLWHLPGIGVQAPLLPRVQAKKGQPPSFLPTK